MTEPRDGSVGVAARVGEIVLTAAGFEGDRREAYLREIAAAEPEAVAAARRRLAAADDLSETFLKGPAAARLGAPTDASRAAEEGSPGAVPGVVLPPEERYEIGEILGVGGMGRVVEAWDRQLDRQVALKFLTHEDPAILHLFLAEARAQARVRDDHVLEIYDSGELAGQPYIAMQRVDGGTLEDVTGGLSLERKVRLLTQAARGLHAAHREGLLHRDVKPANLLVETTGDGELRALVTDFGLATDLDTAGSGTADTIAGTPQYVAPECLAPERDGRVVGVDRRSDVYSLGMTMYRLLTGSLPFSGSNTVEVLRGVMAHDVPAPRHVRPGLPAELEAIILRCTALDPEQRYPSARAVAQDLERYLEGEVVEAYAASLAYRLMRWVLRNRVLAGTAAVALAGLLVASVAVGVFALRADAARERAEARQGQAEELIRFMVVELEEKLDGRSRLEVLTDVGRAAEEYFAAVPEIELSEEELLRRSRMLYQLGDVRIRSGDLAGAAAPMAESLALAERLVTLQPEDGERLFELGQAHFWVGFVAWEQGDVASARGPWEKYLETSLQLVEKAPDNLEWRRELSYAHSNLGSLLEAEGELEAALGQFFATLAIDQDLVKLDPGTALRSEMAATHNTIGVVLQNMGRWGEALEHLRADLEIRRALVVAAPTDLRELDRLGASHGHLGIHLSMTGDWLAAEASFRDQREIFTELTAHDEAQTSWRYRLTWSWLGIGRAALARGDLTSAGQAWQVALKGIDALLALDATSHKWRRTRAICLYHLAFLQRARGDATTRGTVHAARDTARAAVGILEELAAARPTDRAVSRWLSQSHLLLGRLEGRPEAAVAAFERAAEVIAPFARGSRDVRVLAPWAAALHCLGRAGVGPVLEQLHRLRYFEPGLADFRHRGTDALDGFCPAMSLFPGDFREGG